MKLFCFYHKRLERERQEEGKRTTSLLDKEKELLKKESDIQGKLVTSKELMKDGSLKLNKAVKKGDLKGAGVAQMMIATTTSKIEKLRREVDKVRESQKHVEKEKRKLLENKLESKSRSSTARNEKSTDKVKVPALNKRKATGESTSSKKHKPLDKQYFT